MKPYSPHRHQSGLYIYIKPVYSLHRSKQKLLLDLIEYPLIWQTEANKTETCKMNYEKDKPWREMKLKAGKGGGWERVVWRGLALPSDWPPPLPHNKVLRLVAAPELTHTQEKAAAERRGRSCQSFTRILLL